MAAAPTRPRGVAIVGGGPAGLMAAEAALGDRVEVDLFDGMASCGRKFLLAGKGGLNLTHAEPGERFLTRYAPPHSALLAAVRDFDAAAVRAWAADLGIETFVGSSARVFPTDLKAAPLLRRWLQRLRAAGVRFHLRHRWRGWTDDGALCFDTDQGATTAYADATVLALGGASWPELGADGRWTPLLGARGVGITPLAPANCGFDCAWSTYLVERWAGTAVKPVILSGGHGSDCWSQRGELIVTARGVEGSLAYAVSRRLRETIARDGSAEVRLDLAPDRDRARLEHALAAPRGRHTLAHHLQRRAGLAGVKVALLHERCAAADLADPVRLAAAIKSLPVTLTAPRPLAEAISTAGGVDFAALDGFMLRALPGVFCAGEMLDWEAPTGGYLITACLASGRAAGAAARSWALDYRPMTDVERSFNSARE